MAKEYHDLIGSVEIILTNCGGALLSRRFVHNTIVNCGREIVAERFKNRTSTKSLRVAVGRSGADVLAEHTEAARDSIASTSPDEEPTVEIDSAGDRARLTFSATFGRTEGNALLREAGIVFEDEDPAVADVLYNVVTFAVIDKKEGDVLKLNWEVVF